MVRSREVTEAEFAVLRELWREGARSIRDMTDRLYPGGGNSEYSTVQKLCERLSTKGLVEADRSRRPHQYRACVDRDSWIGRRLDAMAEELCSGSYVPLVTQLIRGGKFSREDVDRLREEVARLDEEPRTPAGRRGRKPR